VAPLGTARLPWWTCGRSPKTTPEATSGVGPPPPATIVTRTFGISNPTDHVNASVPPSAHVCVASGPAAARRGQSSQARYLYYSSLLPTMFPGTYDRSGGYTVFARESSVDLWSFLYAGNDACGCYAPLEKVRRLRLHGDQGHSKASVRRVSQRSEQNACCTSRPHRPRDLLDPARGRQADGVAPTAHRHKQGWSTTLAETLVNVWSDGGRRARGTK